MWVIRNIEVETGCEASGLRSEDATGECTDWFGKYINRKCGNTE